MLFRSILLDDYSLCNIGHDSDIAELIKQTSLIIWDEAPMQHRFSFECLDRTLRDLMKDVDPSRYHVPFGGITVLFGGDFRQILPVIPFASRGDVVSASITRSRLWPLCKFFSLTQNMRIIQGETEGKNTELKEFADWVLSIGNGTVKGTDDSNCHSNEFEIDIPTKFCNLQGSNSVDKMIEAVYPDFEVKFKCPQYLSERAILTPTNQSVANMNAVIVEKIPGQSVTYYSLDTAEDFAGSD